MSLRTQFAVVFAFFVFAVGARAHAQDLYDTTVLRTINLQFHDADWLTRLRNNYASQTLILADLTIAGQTYPNVGVRIRGNTSYTQLPSDSLKFSLKVELDFVDTNQELWGYEELNLNNGFRDPTFMREVSFNNYVAQFVPNPRANHVVLTLNGENWGVYNNIQHTDKRMYRRYFENADGMRVLCANQPNGPGLRYNGPNASGYTIYEIQQDGGLANPIGALIAVTDALTNFSLSNPPAIDALFAIDPSTWAVVMENFLTDDDSYVNKGCDFLVYRDPLDGRTHLTPRDANETFSQATWAPTRNFTQTTKPLLNRVLSVPELRQRFFAHYRVARRDLTMAYFGPIFDAQRALIDAAVQADPKKLYSYTLFQQNFTQTVNMPIPGLGGGNIIGLQQFVEQRASFLDTVAELVAPGPTISAAAASNNFPAPAEIVVITANVAANGSGVGAVELYYRPQRDGLYLRTPMFDDGAHGDGGAGDGVWGVTLPVAGTSGQRVAWYVSARSSNSFQSLSFLPEKTERAPRIVDFFQGTPEGMRISEWMYSGGSGEFIEFTNTTGAAIDLTGWSLDDDHATAGAFSLSAFGVVAPGESVVVTEADAAAFRSAWNLAPTVKVIGSFGSVGGGNNLGRNDQIHLFDSGAALQDRLWYGDQTYPGSIRTQNRSGQVGCDAVGLNQLPAWTLSTVGDVFGSYAATSGDVGTPGSSVVAQCGGMFADGFE
ncbi:MAG: CotH kinase family protein [Xanthomonadales bacterium]|nr:hypothetical protein [Xanthomonadales bacterium]MCC6594787.1 CotH kinase family protein [Xanthomonadales bacterium]